MVVRARNERVRKMRDKTIDVLLQMGVPASIKGFTYICDAIELFDTDPYYPDGKICSLYFEIARLHETTASRVERAIRHAFEVALTKGDRDIVELYLDCEHTQNSNLLKTLYFRMQQEERKREKDFICSSSICEVKAQIYQEVVDLFSVEVRTFSGKNAEYVRKALLIAPLYQNMHILLQNGQERKSIEYAIFNHAGCGTRRKRSGSSV